MDNDAAPFYWMEVAESVPIRFGDLASMMAAAQFPEDSERAALSQVVAEDNIVEKLTRMVAAGTLAVRNRHGLTRLDSPSGRLLEDAVLMPQVDLAPLRAEFGIGIRFMPHGSGPDLWTIEHAATALAEQEGWNFEARDTLRRQMLQGARTGSLRARHPHTDLPIEEGDARNDVRDWYELVTRKDVNDWLDTQGATYRWQDALPVHLDAETRQDERLKAYRAAGFQPPKEGARWQGVGKVAETLKVSRQTLTDDLKAAWVREKEKKRAGAALRI